LIITRLDPPISVYVHADKLRGWPAGPALCYAWVDHFPDSDTHWRVCFTNGAAWYDVPGRLVRGFDNLNQGRKNGNELCTVENEVVMWVTMDGNLKAWFKRDCDPNAYRDGKKWVLCED